MAEEIRPVKAKSVRTGPALPRPVFLTVLCLFTFVFLALMCIVLFMGIFWSEWITEVTNRYAPLEVYSNKIILAIFITGFLLHAIAFAGCILIWKLKKTGYYMLGISFLLIASFQAFQPQIAVSATAAYVCLLLLFGLFFRRLN